MTLTLHVVRQPDDAHLAQARIEDGDVQVSLQLEAGQLRGTVLESAADGPPREVGAAEIIRLFDDTVRFWHNWLARSTYVGRWREPVHRSVITLKPMTYASTAGLPEQVGGERNWDYRYTWVREASFSAFACSDWVFRRRGSAVRWLAGRPDAGARRGRGWPAHHQARGDGRRAGHRQAGRPLRPGRVAGRPARLGGHVHLVHVRLRGRARPCGPGRRVPRAFEKMLTYANHVGLFSEEIALNGEQISNFPQAFTHLALIDAAITLDAG
jgi:GH15 family glucan-1,4-alpha-glucosidase